MTLDWLQQTLAVLPYALWLYVAMGVPYALLVLPRADWHQRALVVAVGFALAPALLTAYLLGLGWGGALLDMRLLCFDLALAGLIALTLIGWGACAYKWRTTRPAPKVASSPWAFDEKLLIGLIVGALAVRWVVTSFWTFTAYDALWVYGYQSRLYFLEGVIPNDIGYYPQFLQLQYTFMQLAYGVISDYAARAVLPFLHLGSILAVYALGTTLFSRRVGIIMAGLWTLYPHVARWSAIGDLEIPLTFAFTLTLTFFMRAWMNPDDRWRRRYDALLAGVMFGIAMWIKPTAGAFIIGVILLVVIEFVRVRTDVRAWYPRFEVAALTGLACIPLGSIWYARNALLGLPPLVFPHESWVTRATRSGDLLSWLILPLILLVLVILVRDRGGQLWRKLILLIGVGLLLLGAMPSSPLINPARIDPPASYIRAHEWALLGLGLGLIVWQLRPYITAPVPATLRRLAWFGLVITPYFVTWFMSYSYHARLSFAITPALMLPTALLLAHYLPAQQVRAWGIGRKTALGLILLIAGLGVIPQSYLSMSRYTDYLWTERYPTDFDKYLAHNPGVSLAAQQLWGWQAQNDREPVVVAPGEQRLPFFLPQATIITDTVPTELEYLESVGATHYQYGTQAGWRYENDEGIPPTANQIVSSLARADIMTRKLFFNDGTFRYELYELHLDNRYIAPDATDIYILPQPVQFGDFATLRGVNIGNDQLLGNKLFLSFLWDVHAPAPADYTVRLDLRHEPSATIYHTWQAPVAQDERGYYYNTRLWDAGERVIDARAVQLPPPYRDYPRGYDYRILLNLVDQATGATVPITIDGELYPQGYPLHTTFGVGRPASD
jgi:4-amino-4-deoxy-L-arabinose transferase-like glycosyltransferase